MSYAAKISSKGQVTLPRAIRQALGSNIVELEIAGQKIVLKPVQSVAGALVRYATGKTKLEEVREEIWQEVAYAKGE